MAPDPKQWKKDFDEAHRWAIGAADRAAAPEALEDVRVKALGRSGKLTLLLKSLKDLPLEARREVGGPANAVKTELEALIDRRAAELKSSARDQEIEKTRIDLSLPGARPALGRLHPLTQLIGEMTDILSRLGFSWAEGPQVEKDHYNFNALNIPEDHPARDLQDTFYIRPKLLLRTHTSPVQVRRMESVRPPLRIMSPGRVFRHEAVDASHSAVFHQIEGLYVDRNVSMADLKGTVDSFLQSFFGPKTRTRFRPSYYPFTEPSADVEIQCVICSGSGCAVCKRTGWLEVMGSGMVHPNVLKGVDYDPEVWSGFAFGLGVERFAMMRLGVADIRMFYQNDHRFLEQF